MSNDLAKEQAMILLDRAYRHQTKGEIADAIILYERSLEVWPTAEAYTFLGWTHSMLKRYEKAIDYCEKAIEIDPSFGNPYNDIGAYLIELERWDEVIPWLEKAISATRYGSRHFPYLNLARVYEHFGRYISALESYDLSLEINPYFQDAIWGKHRLLGKLN